MATDGLFVRPLTEKDFRRPGRHTEIFNLDSGLSKAERHFVREGGLALLKNHFEFLPTEKIEKIKMELDRFANCGDEFIPLDCKDCRCRYFGRVRCRSRICEDCCRAWARDIKKQLLPELGRLVGQDRRGYVMSHVVLTVSKWWGADRLPNSGEIRLFSTWVAAWCRLWYGKYVGAWSKSGKILERRNRYLGGASVRVLEFGLDNNNLHAHVITFGPIRPKIRLDVSWSRITGNRGRWVWIERIQRPAKAVGYVMKYLTKPPASEAYSNLAGYTIAIKGTRRLSTGGLLYNKIKSRLVDPDRPDCCCAVCGGALKVGVPISAAEVGDRVDLWKALWKLKKAPDIKIEEIHAGDSLPAELPF